MAQMGRLEEEISMKRLHTQRKKLLVIMEKLYMLHFKLLLHPTEASNLSPIGLYLFADLKQKMLIGKRFSLNEKIVTETNAYRIEILCREALKCLYCS